MFIIGGFTESLHVIDYGGMGDFWKWTSKPGGWITCQVSRVITEHSEGHMSLRGGHQGTCRREMIALTSDTVTASRQLTFTGTINGTSVQLVTGSSRGGQTCMLLLYNAYIEHSKANGLKRNGHLEWYTGRCIRSDKRTGKGLKYGLIYPLKNGPIYRLMYGLTASIRTDIRTCSIRTDIRTGGIRTDIRISSIRTDIRTGSTRTCIIRIDIRIGSIRTDIRTCSKRTDIRSGSIRTDIRGDGLLAEGLRDRLTRTWSLLWDTAWYTPIYPNNRTNRRTDKRTDKCTDLKEHLNRTIDRCKDPSGFTTAIGPCDF